MKMKKARKNGRSRGVLYGKYARAVLRGGKGACSVIGRYCFGGGRFVLLVARGAEGRLDLLAV